MRFNTASIGFFLLTLFFVACKKSKQEDIVPPPPPLPNYPTPIASIISQSMLDSLQAAGVTVYSGKTPPIIHGIFLMSPDSCVYDNSPGNFTGTLFTDYKFRFSNQDNTAFTLTVEQKAIPANTLNVAPAYSYISGSGNNFTVFNLRTVSPQGVTVQQFNIFTGTLTANGIQNFHNTLFIRSKGSDPNNSLPPAGTIRRFVTGGSGLAGISASF